MIYLNSITLSERAYHEIRAMIVRLELPPGAVVREDELKTGLGIGRTPIREALQRLVRDQFVTVISRRGVIVTSIDVSELSNLYETRAILEPYAARLASARGTAADWEAMGSSLALARQPGVTAADLLDIDRACHEIVWRAAGNRFLVDTLDMLYAQSDRLWHIYLAGVADMDHIVDEHRRILGALVAGDADRAAGLVREHVESFDRQIRSAVARLLDPIAVPSAR